MTRHRPRGADYVEVPPNRERIERAINDEIRSHLEERVAELIASGVAPDDARGQAVREFGDLDAARRDLQRIDELAVGTTRLSDATRDLGVDIWRTARSLVRRPGFAAVAVLTLALGVGANAVMFGLVDRLLLSPPPHLRDAGEIVRLRFDEAQRDGGRIQWVRGSFPAFRTLAGGEGVFADVAAYADRALTFSAGDVAEEARVLAVTHSYFALLGPRPALGRFFNGGRDGTAGRAGGADARSAVISHAFWTRHFAGEASVLERTIQLGGEPFTVVGVAPNGFTGDGIDPVDAWIPLVNGTPAAPADWETNADVRVASVVARLRPGSSRTSVEQAAREATQLYRSALAGTQSADSTARVHLRGLIPGRDTGDVGVTPEARVTLWLQGVSLLVLLIAVANVTNLLLLRAIERQGETAVRLALGISRMRLVRHLALESAMLAGGGGAVALVIARWAGPALWRLVLPAGTDVDASQTRILTATAAVALGAALLMTILPAFVQRTMRVGDALRGGSRGTSRRSSAVGELLVAVQVSLTVVLLVGAGLFVRSLLRVQGLDLGFAAQHIVGVRVNTGRAGRDSAATAAILATAREAIQRQPGVRGVALGQSTPFRASLNLPFFLPGRDALPGVGPNRLGYPTFFAVSPEYFDVLGIPILRGRGFMLADDRGAARVMLVDATMARTFWPGSDALGQCVRLGADTMPCTTVVGVVGDTRRSVAEARHSLRYFVPFAQSPNRGGERYLFARMEHRAVAMEAAVRGATIAALASAPFVEVFAIERLLDQQSRQWRLGTAAFVGFGLLATLVAAIGLYGVVAFSVARRERELGIRRALGAPVASLLAGVGRGAAARALLGLGVGGALSWMLTRRIRDLLFQPSPGDAVAYGVAAGIVLLATLVASVGPAWRATRADPMRALRSE